MNSLLRSVTLVGNKRDALIRDSLQDHLNNSVIEIQGITENEENLPVGNCEEANTLCSVIEALFLHGLKDSLLNRVSEAISGPDFDAMPQPSFWGPLLVCSHRQIIDQIQNFTQITTEVGYCRAWIRLALNDGLLSSYFSSIRRDNSVLKPYYNRAAFLRDSDLVHVAQRLIESIDYIAFDLACNTSLLNVWSSTPLLMAATWSPSLKSCPVSSAVDVAKTINSELTLGLEDLDRVETASSIGSLGSLNSSQSVLNNVASMSENDALKIILGEGRNSRLTPDASSSMVQEEQAEKSHQIQMPVEKIQNKQLEDNASEIKPQTMSREDNEAKGETEAERTEPVNDGAGTTVGNSLIGRLGWSSSFEDCESSLITSAISQGSETDAPRTPADARTYDSLIQSYHTAGHVTSPDLKEFLNGSLPKESVGNGSSEKPKSTSEVEVRCCCFEKKKKRNCYEIAKILIISVIVFRKRIPVCWMNSWVN